jgi:hypothetical protein
MPLGRKDLKDQFSATNGSTLPTQAKFALLIDAALNRNDDKFYGMWMPDTPYTPGAVVFYKKGKTFYMLNDGLADPYCNATTPDCDKNWCKIGGEDEDWVISGTSMYANDAVKYVGIGTKKPTAPLQVETYNKGEIRLEPNLDDPSVRIVNLNPACDKNEVAIIARTETIDMETNAPKGWRLLKKDKEKPVKQANANLLGQTILSLNLTPEGEPLVGIGTETPQVHLQVGKSDTTNVKINGNTPSVSVHTINANGQKNALEMTLGDPEAAFVTDAKGGFQFKQKERLAPPVSTKGIISADYKERKDETKPLIAKLKTLVTFADNGNVGIATTQPNAPLHIASPNVDTKGADGIIKAAFCASYPIVQLVNLKLGAGEKANYSLMATDNRAAVWMTDTGCFAFRRGPSLVDAEGLVNIKENGKDVVRVFSEGKVLIGEKLQKDDYDLDVAGAARACGFFIETDRARMADDCIEPLSQVDILKKICDPNLRPVRFRWNGSRCEDTGEQGEFGLIADELACVFPEVVRNSTIGECTQSVAYQNLVPVLIRAIQQQQGLIESLQESIASFEERLKELL